MISRINIDRFPIRAGEIRRLEVSGDECITVAIKCFVRDPPPPSFRPCRECGQIPQQPDGSFEIIAPTGMQKTETELRISVTDAVGDHQEIVLELVTQEPEPTPGAVEVSQ